MSKKTKQRTPHILELSQLGHFALMACLCRCTCFCRIHDKVFEYASAMNPNHPEPFGKLQHLTVWWWFFFSTSSPGWPVFPLKPEQTENNRLWWADQRLCSRTWPSGACPRCDMHRLPLAVISTMDRRPRGAVCHLFSRIHLRQTAKVMLTKPPKGEQNKEQTDGHKLAALLL